MKKLFIICLLSLIVLCGCSREYSINKTKVKFDMDVDFRKIHYRTSDTFDYGSEKDFKSYSLYDKKPNVIYSVTVNRLLDSMDENIKKIEEEKQAKKKNKKINGIQWIVLTYKENKLENHLYYASYDDKEYYRIDFYNASIGEEFEKEFMKSIKFE